MASTAAEAAGNAGQDALRFSTALDSGNVDTITDFLGGYDDVFLSHTVFGMNPGGLDPNAFAVGSAAQDARDRVIYNQATGTLLFDADATGGSRRWCSSRRCRPTST